jgi:anti-sigma B factor antagonist
MKITESIQNDIAVLSLAGKLMGGRDTEKVHERVKHVIGRGIFRVIMDLEQLEWLNSAGLGILIASITSLRQKNGTLVLTHVNGKVKEILEMTHMHLVFDQYDSIEQAGQAIGDKQGLV